jgi:hypothetical protein
MPAARHSSSCQLDRRTRSGRRQGYRPITYRLNALMPYRSLSISTHHYVRKLITALEEYPPPLKF